MQYCIFWVFCVFYFVFVYFVRRYHILAIVTMLYITFLWFMYSITRSLYFCTFHWFYLFLLTSHLWQPPICYFYELSFLKIPCISKITWYLSFLVWPVSFSMMPLRFTDVVVNVKISLFFRWMNSIALYVCHPFNHWWTPSYFSVPTTTNNAAMNLGVHISFRIGVFVYFW